jgi:hypothetical protein
LAGVVEGQYPVESIVEVVQERPPDTGKLQMIGLLKGDVEVLVGVADSQIEVRQWAQRTAPAEGATDSGIGFPRLKHVAVLPIAAKIEDVAPIDDMKLRCRNAFA